MKKVLLFLSIFFLLQGFAAEAQQITYRKETIYLDGKPFAYLLKEGSSWAKNYTLQNLKNEELMVAKAVSKEIGDSYDYVYYQLNFKGFTQKAEMEDEKDLARRMAYEIGNLGVISGDELNPEGVQKFLDKYPPRISQRFQKPTKSADKPQVKESQPDPVLKEEPKTTEIKEATAPEMPVKEESKPVLATPTAVSTVQEPTQDKAPTAPVSTSSPATSLPSGNIAVMTSLKFSGNKIMRGKKQIGVFKVSEKAVNSKLQKTYTFHNPANSKVAVATFSDPKSTTCRMYTVKDKMSYNLPVRNDENSLKVLASWLIQNKYL